jgi:putative serine protease PepD
MSLDDDADDDAGALRPPLPPEDRLWRHPSELGLHGSAGAAPRPVLVHPVSRAGAWGTVVVAGLVGAVLMAGILTVSGQLERGVVERPVVEKVALSTLVPTPKLKSGDSDGVVASVVRSIEPAIVRLELSSDEHTATGSGVVFRDDGMVLTSAHLVDDATRVAVRLSDGRRLAGRVVGVDPVTDVAVVDVDATGLPVAVLGSAKGVEVGASALAIGSPMGDQGGTSVTTGVISALGRSITSGGASLHGLLQTDAPIAATSSGGALVDTAGSVIGIVTGFAADTGDDGDRFGFATPIDLAHRIALQLIETGHAAHGWLGVEGEDLSADEAAAMGLHGGARVRGVSQGSPADKAGLNDDDVITDVDGQEVESMPGLAVEVREHQPGDHVEVGYMRDGEHQTAEVTVGDRPAATTTSTTP